MNAVERVLEYTHLDNEEDMKKYPESIETCYEKGVVSFDGVYLGYYLDSRVVIGKKGFVILNSCDPKNRVKQQLEDKIPYQFFLHVWQNYGQIWLPIQKYTCHILISYLNEDNRNSIVIRILNMSNQSKSFNVGMLSRQKLINVG